jgi:hypothetical protein
MRLQFSKSHFSDKALTLLITIFKNAIPANSGCVLCNCVTELNNNGVNTYCSYRTTLLRMQPLLLSLLQTQICIWNAAAVS